MTAFILTFSSHVSRKRPADIFLNFLTHSTSILIVFLNEVSSALMASNGNNLEPAAAIQSYLGQNPNSNLANVLDRKEQGKKLRVVADDILQTFLDSKAYNCEPVKVFLKEALAGLILESTLDTCSKADWLNGWIVYLLEEGEPEILSAIDVGVGDATTKNVDDPLSHRQTDHSIASLSNVKERVQGKSVSETPQGGNDDATRKAMLEAKRLSEMIAAEEAKRTEATVDSVERNPSTASTDALPTPTSSQSDLQDMDQNPTSKEAMALPPEQRQYRDAADISSQRSEASATPFTDFSQLTLPPNPVMEASRIPPLTLHNAKVVIFDDGQSNDRVSLRSKPVADYLLQIEPASSHHRGWMIARKYADFETLHEVLRRISVISGVSDFTQNYAAVPGWKGKGSTALRLDLEGYLVEALRHVRLAESEGMKRFLEKDQALDKLSNSKGLLGFPSPEAFQNVGKGMLDVLASAPKGAAGGGKALFDGVSGVFQKKSSGPARPSAASGSNSTNNFQRHPNGRKLDSDASSSTGSADTPRDDGYTTQAGLNPKAADDNQFLSRTSSEMVRPSIQRSRPSGDAFERRNALRSSLDDHSASGGDEHPKSQNRVTFDRPTSGANDYKDLQLNLPPPPSEIPEDYDSPTVTADFSHRSFNEEQMVPERGRLSSTISSMRDRLKDIEGAGEVNSTTVRTTKALSTPLTGEETQVAVELLFAIISELYTLSSVWSIRRTLLNAAKAFLLRPGNPSLEAIRVLLQEKVIDANTTDTGLAAQLRKLRENTMPTEEELAQWPPPLLQEEQNTLKRKARRLLVEQGMPPALKGVMGSSASSEALSRIFDSLQIEEVSRGLLFALMLQGIRALTH